MAGSVSYIFSTLEKFADDSNTTLDQWLKKFDRCCIVAGKADGPLGNVKGQLLFLYVEGRARAILEEYEETLDAGPQTYEVLKAKLKEHFESASTKEQAMKKFETRVQKIDESEEEFMLDLVKLYGLANPTHDAAIKLAAIKRKFLNGVSPDLRRNVFVFCNNPFAADVTRDNMLEYCRNAKMHLSVKTEPNVGNIETVMVANNLTPSSSAVGPNADLAMAMNNLSLQFKEHVETTERRFDDFSEAISVMGSNRGGRANRGSYRGGRGGFRGSFRGNSFNRGGGQQRYNDSNSRGGYNQGRKRCYRCGTVGHIAKFCSQQENC